MSAQVGLVLLAAGGSQRMGRPKLLLPLDGVSLARCAALAATHTACRPVVVVIGAARERVRAEMYDLPVLVVENPGWATGMSTSIRAGLAAVLGAARGTDGVVIALADQALVTADHIRRLVHEAARSTATIVDSEYAGTLGPPVLFGRRHFDELLTLAGPEGARAILARNRGRVRAVPLQEGAVDVDTPADYERARAIFGPSAASPYAAEPRHAQSPLSDRTRNGADPVARTLPAPSSRSTRAS